MGKYYYVYMVNSTSYRSDDGRYKENETYKRLKNIAGNASLGYSEPNALALYGVKSETRTRTVDGFWGRRKEQYRESVPFFLICEDTNDGYLEEVITGRRYPKKENRYNFDNQYSKTLMLSIIREIPTSKVAETLKSLSKNEVSAITNRIHQLEHAIYYGYFDDMKRQQEEKATLKKDEDYIKSFRKRHDK